MIPKVSCRLNFGEHDGSTSLVLSKRPFTKAAAVDAVTKISKLTALPRSVVWEAIKNTLFELPKKK